MKESIIVKLRQLACKLFDHCWQDEKEFVSCARCHRVLSGKEFSQRGYVLSRNSKRGSA